MLNRKLPPQIASRLLEDMIPKPVLRLFTKWQSGELQLHKEVNVPRYHDQLKILRRYFLIDQPVARKSQAQKNAYHREYLRAWRLKHRACSCKLKSAQ